MEVEKKKARFRVACASGRGMDDLISCARLEAVGLGVDALRVDSRGAS